MKNINISKLKKLSLQATSGPWYRTEKSYGDEYVTGGVYGVGTNGERPDLLQIEDTICEVWNTEYDGAANGAFIAAANPDVVYALCEEIERLNSKIKKLTNKN